MNYNEYIFYQFFIKNKMKNFIFNLKSFKFNQSVIN